MSRANRRASRGGARNKPVARSRRTPVRAKGAGGPNIPWVPVLMAMGAVVVVAMIAYLIWQQAKPAGSRFEQARAAEADASPDLPGEYVNLPQIYDGFYGNDEGNNTGDHVNREVDYTEQGLPPVGGPHWGSSGCGDDATSAPPFCGPAPWGIYREPWPAATLIHNMEHGGVVVWYNTTNQEVIDDLEDFADAQFDDDRNLVLSPYPDMEAETVAITVWSRREKMAVSEYDRERLENFVDKLYCRFNPEDIC